MTKKPTQDVETKVNDEGPSVRRQMTWVTLGMILTFTILVGIVQPGLLTGRSSGNNQPMGCGGPPPTNSETNSTIAAKKPKLGVSQSALTYGPAVCYYSGSFSKSCGTPNPKDLCTNKNHCGACGRQCQNNQQCIKGVCGCPQGKVLCNGQCVPEDNQNCGSCGYVCSGGTTCSNGSCCQNGKIYINGACYDSTDPQSCVANGQTCSANQACYKGRCWDSNASCLNGLTFCSNLYACFPSNQLAHGGGCTTRICRTTKYLNGGSGHPGPKECIDEYGPYDDHLYTTCGIYQKVKRDSDPHHCGKCGRRCDPGVQCNYGRCQCEAGKYMDVQSGSCKICPTGTYQDETGQTRCKACPAGTKNPNTGSTSASACVACPTGTYQDQTGAHWCKSCVKGTYNPNTGSTSSSACQPCAAGTFNDGYAKASCVTCPTGTYQDQTGQQFCKTCAIGTYQDQTGQSSCNSCTESTTCSTGSTSSSACVSYCTSARQIEIVRHGKCLDLEGASTSNGSGLVQWSCSNNRSSQQFVIVADGEYVRVKHSGSGKCIDVAGGNTANGTKIQLYSCAYNNANQQFKLQYIPGTRAFMIRNKTTDKCLDLVGGNSADGTAIQLYTCLSQNLNQRFTQK